MTDILITNALRRSVESASNGAQTVLFTAKGQPSFVNIIPKFDVSTISTELGSGTHPAFIVNGTEVSQIYVGTYPGTIVNGELLSLPDREASVNQQYDAWVTYAKAAGTGWHLMTNAEWSAVAMRSILAGFQPDGNTVYGVSYEDSTQKGRRSDGLTPGTQSGTGTTLTGSGPTPWRHDNTMAGISDLAGNIWEAVTGYRIVAGEIQVMTNNNAAIAGTDHSTTSSAWMAIDGSTGLLVTPTFTGSIANSNYVPTTSNSVRVATSGTTAYTLVVPASGAWTGITNPSSTPVSAAALKTLKQLLIIPLTSLTTDDYIFYGSGYEIMPRRGGAFTNNAGGGIFATVANNGRVAMSANNSGGRPVYYSS
ncbi:MAG: hypothetical protein [Caudoviricetes sp.]|nr:MAG: hypothetical protein [Caudoviricetes sp.]